MIGVFFVPISVSNFHFQFPFSVSISVSFPFPAFPYARKEGGGLIFEYAISLEYKPPPKLHPKWKEKK